MALKKKTFIVHKALLFVSNTILIISNILSQRLSFSESQRLFALIVSNSNKFDYLPTKTVVDHCVEESKYRIWSVKLQTEYTQSEIVYSI